MYGDGTSAAAREECTELAGGASVAGAGVGVEALLNGVTAATGRSWRNVARACKGLVAKDEATCGAATGATEWGGGGATSAWSAAATRRDGVPMGGATGVTARGDGAAANEAPRTDVDPGCGAMKSAHQRHAEEGDLGRRIELPQRRRPRNHVAYRPEAVQFVVAQILQRERQLWMASVERHAWRDYVNGRAY